MLLVVGGRRFQMWGGSEEGSEPSVSSTGPRPGVVSLGVGTAPAPVCFCQVTLGAAGPGLPHSESWTCLEAREGLWSGGRWGLDSGREGLTPAPRVPTRP